MFGLFKNLSHSVSKSAKKLFGRVEEIFANKNLDNASIEEIEELLYKADFGVKATEQILKDIKILYSTNKSIRQEDIFQIATVVLKETLANCNGVINFNHDVVNVITLIGTNGAGKTTTAAKLASFFHKKGFSILLGACDTFRAAANEQINRWADKLSIDIVSSMHGADSAAVAYDSYNAAVARGHDVLILDTAGRLHTKTHLMAELEKINKALKKLNSEVQNNIWLVIDGSIGSNSINVAKTFYKEIGLTGIIITKLDGTSRGGAIVGIFDELKIPIFFVGTGEQPEDLHEFVVEDYLKVLFKN